MTELVWALAGAKGAEGLAKRKSRSLSYTGCWTCRERKVKCDERPIACSTCECAGRRCAGYGTRLVWLSGTRRNSSPRPRRRRLQHGQAPSQRAGSGEEPISSTGQALFSILASSDLPHPPPATISPSQHPQEREIDSETWIDLQSVSETTLTNSSADISHSHGTVVSSGGADNISSPVDEVIRSPLSLSRNVSALCATSPLSHPWSHSAAFHFEHDIPEVPDSSMDQSYSPAVFHLPHDSLISLDRPLPLYFSGQSPATILLRHYMEDVVYLMQPVSHQSNPFKTIYLTTALEGSCDSASRELSTATVSVYHSVLAVAAMHLQRSSPQETSYLNEMACYHRQKALEAARSSLDHKKCSYRAVMTAMLSLVSADIMDGGINDHWIHLEAARTLQESRSRYRLLSRHTRQLNTICKMLRLFAQTTQTLNRLEMSSSEYTGLEKLGLDDLEPCIEFIYGITPFIATCIFQIFHLSQYLASYPEGAYPEELLEACETLGDKLLSWTIDSELFSTIDASDEQMLGVAKAQTTAFYNATLIYYYRSIHKCDRDELRAEQRATIEAMNLAEDMKSNSAERRHWPAPITWPAFIASCEAADEDRQDWASWWERVQDYRMNNYLKQWAIVKSIWQKLDASDSSIDWREILADLDIVVIAV